MTARPGGDERHAAADAVLYLVALRGLASCEHLAAPAGSTPGEIAAVVAALEAAALVERRGDRLVLTAAGRERAGLVREHEGRALAEPVGLVYDRFAALNREVKSALHRWQVRTDGSVDLPNDHADAAYDAAVLEDLERVHRAAGVVLAALAALRPRYADYRRRLGAALARAAAGDRRAVAGVTADSFHAAWWELHADLLAVLGRVRGPEDA
jgi:hypothetical protein